MHSLLITLLSLSPPASAAAPDDVSIRTNVGAWWVKNPTAGIGVLAPELGLSAQWRGLEVGVSDHTFLTVAGADHLWGPDLRWSRAWGEGTWAPYSSLGGQLLLGGPAPVLPVGRAEGGARWQKGHLEARLGAELMGSSRALGGGARLSLGGVL